MDALTQSALMGTAHQQDASTTTGTALDGMRGALDAVSSERRILLTAGALAVYRLAGHLPATTLDTPAACPVESRSFCPPGAAHLLAMLFESAHAALLPEALGYAARAGCVLPHGLLPRALGIRDGELRAAVRPVLGERGRWLARQNPDWHWAAAEPSDDLPPDAEQIWQEGTAAERRDVFRRLRLADPERARAWLAAVWSSEKLEMRGELLALLASHLSAGDEAVLESALADRAASVRSIAVPLLARVPGSAFARRMLERATNLLIYADGTLRLTLPRRLDDAWKHDGIHEQPPHGLGKGAWWAIQVLSLVPLAHWQTLTGHEPARLLALLAADDVALVAESWSRGGRPPEETAWMPALWDWWQRTDAHQSAPAAENLALLLFAHLPREEAEQRILGELTQHPAGWEDRVPAMLARLAAPWGEPLAQAYLAGLRERVARVTPTDQDWSDPFLLTLDRAALAWPVAMIPRTLEPLTVPTSNTYFVRQWSERLRAFAETLALRQRIRQEIPG